MANHGNYHYQSNFKDVEQNRRPVESLFDMRSPSKDRFSSQGMQSSNYRDGSYSQSYGGRPYQGGDASRYNADDLYSRRGGGYSEETSQQSSYPPQAKPISDLFDIPSERSQRMPDRKYEERGHQSGNSYQQTESNYQARANQGGNNYRQPESNYQARGNPSGNNDYRQPVSNYQQNYQARANLSGNNDYQQPVSNYQQNYQARANPSGNNDYRQPVSNYQGIQDRVNQGGNSFQPLHQKNQFGKKSISDMFDIPSNSNTSGGQSRGNYGQYQDRSDLGFQTRKETGTSSFYQETSPREMLGPDNRDSSNGGSSYRGQDQFSRGAFSRNVDSRNQRNFLDNSNSFQTSGSNSFQGKFKSQRGRGQNRFHNQKPYDKVETEIEQEDSQVQSQNEDDDNSDEEQPSEVKEGTLKIDPSLAVKYKTHPPSAEELGNIFKDFVIFFHWKEPKSVPEKNHFVVICESFRKSERFDTLQVEDAFQQGDKFTKYCTLRYQGMMMVRGIGLTGNLKEPRVMAAIELINKLAMTCYTLKVNQEYFSKLGLTSMLEQKEEPGVYRVVPEQDVRGIGEARRMVQELVKSDSDCELIFTNPNMLGSIKNFSKDKSMGCETRRSKTAVVVCKARTPQYWRDKLLASGKMESKKLTLIPPQGIGNDLIRDLDITAVIPKLAKGSQELGTRIDPYGPDVRIKAITVPWEQKGLMNKRRKKAIKHKNFKKNRRRRFSSQ